VAAGIDQWLHVGWIHSHPVGHCPCRSGDPTYSGTKSSIAILGCIWKVDGQNLQEDFAEFCFSKKGFVMNNLTIILKKGVTAMKKKNIIIHFLLFLFVIATLAACTATRTQSSAGEYVDDSVITTKVKSLLAADDLLKSFQISVETYKGVVQLSGFVNSQKAVDKASEITKTVKGVTSIKNDLIVK
jgi:hypothetical protein